MDEPDNRNNSMKCDSMGDMFSQIFDQIKPQEPANPTPPTDSNAMGSESGRWGIDRQIRELLGEISTLSL
ncbi:hypothetical protein MCC02031_07280 [Bifidobacteriaceae bacterium MCC02031]|nr:hypothetical protein MCC02031_07280 [Bifidobacteriaceae bacterium MCC02031]